MTARKGFDKELLEIEKAASMLRQRLSDSQVIVSSNGHGKIDFEEVSEDEWSFDRRLTRRTEWTATVIDAMSTMQPGDRVRIGPFSGNRDASRVRSRLSNIVSKVLMWEAPGEGVSPYESHVKDGYIYIMRK